VEAGLVSAPSLAATRPHPSRLRVWFQAIRFFSFTASVVPILVGCAHAVDDGSFDPLLAAAMLLASVACHAGANLTNDYHDHARGIDTPSSLGPSKVIQQGLLAPAAVRRGMLVAFAGATLLGLVIVAATGWAVFWLALASLAVAYLYTGGPKPLGYVALGEVAVFLAMGPGMVLGAVYVLTGHLTATALIASLPVGCLVAAILHANNVRDVEPDRAAGKVTLATRLGRRAASREYAALVLGAYPSIVVLVVLEPTLWPTFLTLTTAPLARALVRAVYREREPRALNGVLRRTAGLHLRFGLLLAGGLLLAALLDRAW
jgi:1,4-dihydroxy-2-naphthoate octaprenyltransferase